MDTKESENIRKIQDKNFGTKKLKKHELIKAIAQREATPEVQRIPFHKQEFCDLYRTTSATYDKLWADIQNASEKEEPILIDANPDALAKWVIEMGMSGKNPQYTKFAMDLLGLNKVEEDDDRIDPDDFQEANLAAIRELQMEGYRGVAEMPSLPPVLHDELREDTGQDSPGDNSLAGLGAS